MIVPSESGGLRKQLIACIEKLPDAKAVPEGDHLSLEVRRKRFGWLLYDHHDDGRIALHCKASPGQNEKLSGTFPERFHIPKHNGHHGWVGLWLDLEEVDWTEVERLLADAYCLAAPKKLVAELEKGSS